MRISRLLAVLALAGAGWAIPANAQEPVPVEIRDNEYVPVRVEIPAGGTVSWEHVGTNPHTITSQPGSPNQFDSHPDCPDNAASCMYHGARYYADVHRAGHAPVLLQDPRAGGRGSRSEPRPRGPAV